MFKNYLKIAFRNIWKSKGYAFINIVGLSVAFCVSVFLFLTSYFQLTFDNFHEDGDRIYQTYFFSNDPEKAGKTTTMPFPLTPALKAEFPEIEGIARVVNGGDVVEYKGKYFDKQVKFTDPDFLKIFSFPLIKGNKESALKDLSNIIISENMAKSVFGTEDPMGKTLQLGLGANKKQYVVSGVLGDFPDNSTIEFDAFIRSENVSDYQSQKDAWDSRSHLVFLKLSPNTNRDAFEKKLKPFARKYLTESFASLEKKGAKPDERGDVFAIRLQKMSNVHFGTELATGGSTPATLVYALMGIAFFILLIACINFINLNVARSFIRAREVGVRKSLGALKNQLFVQIWGEAAVICFVGFLIGVILSMLLLPTFNATFKSKLTLDYMLQPDKLVLILGLFVLVTTLAGGYPAWQMSKFNAVEVLKGKLTMKKPGILRNSLIITQFTLSSLLICCTIIAVQQVNHLRNQPLGFQKEEVISIPVGNKVDGFQALQRMRNKLASDPSILGVTGSEVNLGVGADKSTYRSVLGFTYKEKEVSTDWLGVDYEYLKTLNIKLLGGREFDPAYPADSLDRVIITESMAKKIGETDPVGKYFQTDSAGSKIQIIGLIPDFNLYSVKNDKNPITIHLSRTPLYIFVRVTPQSLNVSMDKLKGIWKEITPESEFKGTFMDENTDNWYKEEQRLSNIFSLASGIAILLSCLGLFAVALIVIEQRTKEIGVRKVLGASIPNLVFVLSRDFVKLVVIAILIASPLAWFFMQKWLDNYAYRIEISPLIFIGVGLAAIFVAVGTVSFQSIKAALMNPVKSLKSE
ncbi:ABC transporter permease [Dyadobacter sp. CY312]|uniref:ABC transporter permease n=1 Tax=Dyadobacter sp. CY312 TaxID=2907303 RepID=UPI001F342BA1|nr:ABC transporter permease [Dyadobacter sp. CY312]MCE7040613.1 ABC transporter permease [Dyadobacter sp. CY312]